MNRRLVRSRTDRVIGGVAAGLAEYLNADPALVRVAWALIAVISGGAGLLAYVVAWIVIPEAPEVGMPAVAATDPATGEPARPAAATTAPAGENRAGLVVGIGLVLLGVWFLVREYLPEIDWSLVWPVVLIGVGFLILISTSRRRA